MEGGLELSQLICFEKVPVTPGTGHISSVSGLAMVRGSLPHEFWQVVMVLLYRSSSKEIHVSNLD